MDFLKKPFVAVVLSALIVISSTLVSTNVKLGKKCAKLTDSFYESAVLRRSGGSPIANEIKDICAAAEGLSRIAHSNGLGTEKAELAATEMTACLSKSNVQFIYQAYVHLLKTTDALISELSALSLSERDAEAMDGYIAELESSAEAIAASDYNDNVRKFYREQLRFPAKQLAGLAGVEIPQLFE